MTHTPPDYFMKCSDCGRSTNEVWGTRCPKCYRGVFGEAAGPATLGDAVALTKALETMGNIAGDLLAQRNARDEECVELRGHLAHLLDALCGKVRSKKEISRLVQSAQEYLTRPRSANQGSPQVKVPKR